MTQTLACLILLLWEKVKQITTFFIQRNLFILVFMMTRTRSDWVNMFSTLNLLHSFTVDIGLGKQQFVYSEYQLTFLT